MKKKKHLGIDIDLSRDELISEQGSQLLKKHYMLEGEESPQELYARAAVAYCFGDLEFAQRIYDYASKGWFGFASPVLSNAPSIDWEKVGQYDWKGVSGRTTSKKELQQQIIKQQVKSKGLPISCFLLFVSDSIEGLIEHQAEAEWLSVKGGGIGAHWSEVRSISKKTTGPIPFMKTMDAAVLAFRQGQTRNASYASFMDIRHPDIMEFISMRTPTGADNLDRKCLNLHIGVTFGDEFVQAILHNDDWQLIDPNDKNVRDTVKARTLWEQLLETRNRTGEPYLIYLDEANRRLPGHLQEKGLKINGSNLCLAGSNKLLTANGYRTIRELWEDDPKDFSYNQKWNTIKIINSKGEMEATQIFRTGLAEDVYDVELADGTVIRATAEHQFFDQNMKKKRLKELRVGDLLPLHLSGFEAEGDPNYAELAGMIIGDGSIANHGNQQKAYLRLWNDDIKYTQYWQSKLKELYQNHCQSPLKQQVNSTFRIDENVKGFGYSRAQAVSAVLGRMMKEDGLVPGQKHRVPASIWSSGGRTVGAFLKGLFSADGHVYTNDKGVAYIGLASVEKELLRDVSILLKSLGVKARMCLLREARQQEMKDGTGGMKLYQGREIWRLHISGRENLERFQQRVGFVQDYKMDRLGSHLQKFPGSNNSKVKPFSPIVDIRYAGQEEVFCLNEPNHNEIVVNGTIISQCTEIFLPTNTERTAVCCLSSINVEKYDDWLGSAKIFIKDLVTLLDNVLELFITLAPTQIEKARNSAEKERSIGLGALGLHAYFQSKGVPWESVSAKGLNNMIFRQIREEADAANTQLAAERGACPDAGEKPIRCSHLLAIAPTANNSIIVNTSPGVEPRSSNAVVHKTRAGTHLITNKYLDKVLQEHRLRLAKEESWLQEVWQSIITAEGSVQHLDFLTELERDIFKTAFEIDQRWIVELARDRQQYIDQGQSINLFFPSNPNKAYVNQVHLLAFLPEGTISGVPLKSLYYFRTKALRNAEKVGQKVERLALKDGNVESAECLSCHS